MEKTHTSKREFFNISHNDILKNDEIMIYVWNLLYHIYIYIYQESVRRTQEPTNNWRAMTEILRWFE